MIPKRLFRKRVSEHARVRDAAGSRFSRRQRRACASSRPKPRTAATGLSAADSQRCTTRFDSSTDRTRVIGERSAGQTAGRSGAAADPWLIPIVTHAVSGRKFRAPPLPLAIEIDDGAPLDETFRPQLPHLIAARCNVAARRDAPLFYSTARAARPPDAPPNPRTSIFDGSSKGASQSNSVPVWFTRPPTSRGCVIEDRCRTRWERSSEFSAEVLAMI